jgi:cell division protein ZipA
MSSLRLAILVIGLILIVVIYVWGTIHYRRIQRKQAVGSVHAVPAAEETGVAAQLDDDDIYAGVLSTLNQSLAESKHTPATAPRVNSDGARRLAPRTHAPQTRDMFPSDADEQCSSSNYQNVDDNRIIALHVTALPTKAFNGNDILDAVNHLGLEFGEMNIFHHYGIGDMQSEQPLFSLADMFEPGSFDLTQLDRRQTRGLTLFFCLPLPVDGQVVFELMLNTAQRLARRLGGEIRGPDHRVINDQQLAALRSKISSHSSV